MDFEEYGGIADDMSNERAWQNGRLMNETLNSLEPGPVSYTHLTLPTILLV